MSRDEEQLEGRNPIREAIRAGRPIQKILVARGERHGSLREILDLARARRIPVQEVERAALERLATTGAHQGIIAQVAAKSYATLEEVLKRAESRGEPPFLLLLDGIEDPQNLGSLLRTAEAAGVHGVVIPARRAAGLTAQVAKSSAGAVEYLPVVRVTNLVQTMEELKERGLWLAGAEMTGEEYWGAALTGPLGLVVGGEGKGLHRLVRERCDLLVRIPMYGRITSLNAGVAGALLLYEVRRQRAAASDPSG